MVLKDILPRFAWGLINETVSSYSREGLVETPECLCYAENCTPSAALIQVYPSAILGAAIRKLISHQRPGFLLSMACWLLGQLEWRGSWPVDD